MLFTFLISIVFIAEVIIAISAIISLVKLDKMVLELVETVKLAQPKIKDISGLVVAITEQWTEIAEDYVSKFKNKGEDVALRFLTKLFGAMLLWKINSKLIRKITKSRTFKIIGKGLSLLENMV